ncbi:MAG: nucleoside-diphosphate sugar epimerase [Methylophilales bacterium 28-44-11]|nr:MAG: nucleoside-diphosphate sugar epimerase [Methylophilales bacterium 28-44-11]
MKLTKLIKVFSRYQLNILNTIDCENQIIIWRLIDGKPGHENQSLGLVNSLRQKVNSKCFDIRVSNDLDALFNLFTATWGLASGLPLPDLIIGAGHATHLHALAAKRAFGGKIIILMQPSLPVSWFDLCLIPEHDAYRGRGEYLETRGVLNPIKPDGQHHQNKSLIMVGGSSKHCLWKTSDLVAQVYELVKKNPNIEYTLTTSRRTPKDFISAVKRIHFSNLMIVPFADTESGWVSKQLAESASAWVTEDSVSMVYESLTANVAVGLLNLDTMRDSRVTRGVKSLVSQGLVTRFDFSGMYQNKLSPVLGFTEANRCSNWILERWMQPRAAQKHVCESQLEF